MLLTGLICLTCLAPGPGCCSWQDPNDPLIFAPSVRMGSRLQFGINVVPADWRYQGKLAESVTEDDNLTGFRILKMLRTGSSSSPPARDDGAFSEVPCDFSGTTIVISAFSQDGQKHRFILDSGAVKSYVRATLPMEEGGGLRDALPLCLFLPADRWLNFIAAFDPSVGVLANPSPDFPFDGIVGMNAVSCLQLKISYSQRRLWARISSKPLDPKQAGSQLGLTAATMDRLVAIPMTPQKTGRFSVDLDLAGKTVPMEVDTGASVLGVAPSALPQLPLEKVGRGSVLVQGGSQRLSKYLAPAARLGAISFLWPVVYEGTDPRAELGGIGPSMFPHHGVIIDYPGRRLYTLVPTADESVEQALGQLVAGVARIRPSGVLLDMPNVFGQSTTLLVKVQDKPTSVVLSDLRKLLKGDIAARSRLMDLYLQLNGPYGHITVSQDGAETTLNISGHP